MLQLQIAKRIASAGVGFIPIIGDIKDVQEVVTGTDLITGEKLTWVDKEITFICIFLPVVNGKAVREGMGLVDDGADLVKAALKNSDEVIEGAAKTGDAVWDMTKGGKSINGRWYSEHLLERMAPDTPQVRAELETRALDKGLKRGTEAFNKYVDPRGIPASVIEDAIKNGNRVAGKTPYTWECITNDVKAIINEFGDVVTVMPK